MKWTQTGALKEMKAMPLCSPVARSIGMYTSITCAAIERQLVIRQIVRESEGSGRGGQRGAPEIPSLPRSSLEQDLRARTADARCWRTQAHERGKNAARGFAASELNPLFTPCSIARPRLANAPCAHHNPPGCEDPGSSLDGGGLFSQCRGEPPPLGHVSPPWSVHVFGRGANAKKSR